MEYADDLNKLQVKGQKWTSKLYQKIKRHKLITTIVITFFLFSIINIIMIYNFMQILMAY